MRFCNSSVDCSVSSLWQMVQFSIDQLLDKVSLQDLIGSEQNSENLLSNLFQAHLQLLKEAEPAYDKALLNA
jgi:DNA-binding IscR family transcriptional regulator